MYLGRDPNSESLEDLKAGEKALLAIRPYIRYVHSSRYIDDLANGEICLAMGWSGDVKQAMIGPSMPGGVLNWRTTSPRRVRCATSTWWLFLPMRRM